MNSIATNMSASIRRRFSYHASNDNTSTSPSARRFSEDLCQRHCDKGVFQVSGFTPYGKNLSQSGDQESSCENDTKMSKLKRSTSYVKSILKKQNSLCNIDYSYLIPLITPEFDYVTSRDKSDRDSVSSSSSGTSQVRPVTSKHTRRVRFNENISFHEQGLVTNCENLCDYTTDYSENHTIGMLPMTSVDILKQQMFESLSEHVKNHRNKSKKDNRVDSTRKSTKLTQSCPNFGKIVSKPAWVKNTVQNGYAPDNSQTKHQRVQPLIQPHSRSLERAKTDLGPVQYKDVQSKLRRMGFFDTRRNGSTKVTLSNRHNPTKTRNDQDPDENSSEQGNIIEPAFVENRPSGNYTTLREELYDITFDEDSLSMKYVTETCGDESLRSLGDQYARFLKCRYTIDDISCS